MKENHLTHDVQKQLMEAFNFRHATKVFDASKKISDDEFNVILEAARLSPSSFGMEPWQIMVVQTPEKRELFRDFSWGSNGSLSGTPGGQLGTSSHFVILLGHTDVTMKHHSEYQQKHLKEVKHLPDEIVAMYNENFQIFQERDFNIETKEQIIEWCARQAYIAMGNMMNAAALMGIDSCPIEGFEMNKAIAVLEKEFNIDPNVYKPAVMIAFGYRATDPQFPKTRRDMDKIVSWY